MQPPPGPAIGPGFVMFGPARTSQGERALVKSEHGIIRTTDPDDAAFLHTLYADGVPRAALLDNKRETLLPTVVELRELFSRKDAVQGAAYTIEDSTGRIRGFFTLRGINHEGAFAEFTLLFLDPRDYHGLLADAAFDFITARAHRNLRLLKLVAHALESESDWQAFLERKGFADAGTIREALYTLGRWHNIRVYTRFAAAEEAA